MTEKIEGIVINERIYGETSKIVNIITKEKGVISVIAKGSRNLKSDLRNVTAKFSYGLFNLYYKENKLSILKSVDIIDNFKNIKKDLTKISYGTFLLELSEQVMKQSYHNDIYLLLINGLKKINEGYDPLIITNILELKYLDYLGVMPIIDACAICGSNKSIATISSDKGGYICRNCLTNEMIVSDKTIRLIRMFYYIDISKIQKASINENIKKEINFFLDTYYDKYTGLYLKTKSFLKNLNKITN